MKRVKFLNKVFSLALTAALVLGAVYSGDKTTASLAASPEIYEEISKGLSGSIIYEGSRGIKKSSVATKQVDEYSDETAEYVADMMNKELIAYFSGSAGTKASVAEVSKAGYKSQITFTFDNSKLGFPTSKYMLKYVSEAIANNPNLCTLSTYMAYSVASDKTYFKVYSTIAKDGHLAAIREYKDFLAEIEELPKESSTMSDVDILLYLHDRISTSAVYATEEQIDSSPMVYTPIGFERNGIAVCQAYAVVLNHLMKDMRFTCHYVTSDTHAWNAVKLNGKWYYIDSTWDDGDSSMPVDRTFHQYFLVDKSAFKNFHTLSWYHKEALSGIDDGMGTAYNNYYPKVKGISYPMSYKNGKWYFATAGYAYRWAGEGYSAEIISAVPKNTYRRVSVIEGNVFYSGSDGVGVYDDYTEQTAAYNSVSVAQMYYSKGKLHLNTTNGWKYIGRTSAHPSYEKLNGTANKEKISLTKPTKPVIKTTSSAKKKISLKIKTPSQNATAGYRVQIARDEDFTTSKKTFTSNSTASTIKGLVSGATYYVRVRGVWKQGIYVKNGAWSTVVKVKVK